MSMLGSGLFKPTKFGSKRPWAARPQRPIPPPPAIPTPCWESSLPGVPLETGKENIQPASSQRKISVNSEPDKESQVIISTKSSKAPIAAVIIVEQSDSTPATTFKNTLMRSHKEDKKPQHYPLPLSRPESRKTSTQAEDKSTVVAFGNMPKLDLKSAQAMIDVMDSVIQGPRFTAM